MPVLWAQLIMAMHRSVVSKLLLIWPPVSLSAFGDDGDCFA